MRFRVGDKVEVQNVTWTAFYNNGARGRVVHVDEDGVSTAVKFSEGAFASCEDNIWFVPSDCLELLERGDKCNLEGKVILLRNGALFLGIDGRLIGLHSKQTYLISNYVDYEYHEDGYHKKDFDVDSIYHIKDGYNIVDLCNNFGEALELIWSSYGKDE